MIAEYIHLELLIRGRVFFQSCSQQGDGKKTISDLQWHKVDWDCMTRRSLPSFRMCQEDSPIFPDCQREVLPIFTLLGQSEKSFLWPTLPLLEGTLEGADKYTQMTSIRASPELNISKASNFHFASLLRLICATFTSIYRIVMFQWILTEGHRKNYDKWFCCFQHSLASPGQWLSWLPALTKSGLNDAGVGSVS